MSHSRTVAIAQIAPKLGDVAANLSLHQEYIRKAMHAKADVVVFPELGLTGYQVQDLTLDVARDVRHRDVQALVDMSFEIDVLFSFVEETSDHLFYVTALYARGGSIHHLHRKVYLPTYGMFDERRYFAAGQDFQSFDDGHNVGGILICEDAWHVSAPYLLAMQGVTTLFVPASSPGRNVMDASGFGSHAFWRQLLQMYAQLFGSHVVFVNRVGYEDGVHFYGGSGVVGPDGHWLDKLTSDDETLMLYTLDRRDVRRARYTTPLVRDERMHLVASQLASIMQKR